jgi:hypothetical protein
MATLKDIKRSKILKSGTKPANQAASVSEKGSRAREGLANKFIAQAPKSIAPAMARRATGILGVALAPTKAGDGTMQAGTIKKAKAEAARKAKRRPIG